jgi:perosamine synthetase
MFVNHNGYNGIDLKCVRQICDSYKIPMIEDCCQGLGIPGIAKTGDVAAFSFSVPKIITTGQGGCAITNDYKKSEIMQEIRDHGDDWRLTKLHKKLGINLKFNDIAATLGQAQLDNFDWIKKTRKDIWDCYSKSLNIYRWGLDFTWMVCYLAKNPDEIITALHAEDIHATKYYKEISKNPPYKTEEKFPIAEFVEDHLLYLPSSLNLKPEEIEMICSTVKKIENKA